MIFEVLTNPRATLGTVVWERRVWAATGIVGLWALLNLTLTTLLVFGGDLREQFAGLSPAVLDQVVLTLRNLGPVSAFFLPFVWWIGVSTLLLLTASLFGSSSGYATMLSVVGRGVRAVGLRVRAAASSGDGAATVGGRRPLFSARDARLDRVSSLAGLARRSRYRRDEFRRADELPGRGGLLRLDGLGCATAGLVLVISVLTLVFLLSGAT